MAGQTHNSSEVFTVFPTQGEKRGDPGTDLLHFERRTRFFSWCNRRVAQSLLKELVFLSQHVTKTRRGFGGFYTPRRGCRLGSRDLRNLVRRSLSCKGKFEKRPMRTGNRELRVSPSRVRVVADCSMLRPALHRAQAPIEANNYSPLANWAVVLFVGGDVSRPHRIHQ